MTYEIIQVPHDEEGIRSWAFPIRDFRLLCLQTNPEASASIYEREAAFTDDVWRERVADPNVTHFIAVQEGQIVCSLCLLELAVSVENSSPALDPRTLIDPTNKDPSQHHSRLNSMFTHPSARRQGIAQAMIQHALRFGAEAAKKKTTPATAGAPFVASLVVDSDNPAARKLYEKCGFTYVLQVPVPFGRTRDGVLLKYEC